MELQAIQSKIYEIREHKVMLDFDLAELYEVETKVLKQAVNRNIDRFPSDFMFVLTRDEYNFLRSQFVTLETGRGKYSKYLPYAFTEQGVAMLSSVLRSERAICVNISIMRAFVLLREFAISFKELSEKLEELEAKYDMQFEDIYEAINYLLKKDEQEIEQSNRRRIGYI